MNHYDRDRKITMGGTRDRRTKQVQLLSGLLAIGMGLVSVVANWPYLLGATGQDRGVAWFAGGSGAAAIAVGAWVLRGPRSRGKDLVLTRRQWRYGFAALMVSFLAALMAAVLSLPQPQVLTGVQSLLMITVLLQLFVVQGSEEDHVVAFSEAQHRTWRRGIACLMAIGLLAIAGAIALAVAGNMIGADFLIPFGVIFLVFATMMRRQLIRRQDEAPRNTH
ncbi:hypothetical protein [Kocuria nitroreducens]|uniref:hypothetical protein n=1 Tax=Kocuria nitroreducens TaxID=3058914 RepID=UPI0036DD263D